MPAMTRTIPGVEIARVGTWHTRGMDWTVTTADLEDAVRASTDPDFAPAVVHAGHRDPRFRGAEFDGEPALGVLANYRVSDDGQALLADLTGVPAVLADILETSYPRRSIEASLDVISNSGKSYRMVTTGLALLGVTLPAIESLADLPALYGVAPAAQVAASARSVGRVVAATMGGDMSEQVLHPAPVRPGAVRYDAAGQPLEVNGRPVRSTRVLVEASAPLEGIWSAFADWCREQGLDLMLDELGTDYVLACTWSSDETVWRIPWSESGGTFTFGPAVKGAMIWQPGSPAAGATVDAAAGDSGDQGGALPSVRGRGPEGTRKDEPMGVTPRMRELLGLGDDVTDEQAEAALAERLAAVPSNRGPEDEGTGDSGTPAAAPAPTVPVDLERVIEQRVAAALAPMQETIGSLSGQLAERNRRDQVDERARVITAALERGRISPADRETWEGRYDQAPQVTTDILASLADGTAVPMGPLGSAGHQVEASSADDSLYLRVFPGSAPRAGGGE